MAQINYDNKTFLNQNASIPDVNKVTDDDMNEIKQVVNENYNEGTIAMDEIKTYLGGTILWTNPNPTSAFSGQTITLSDSISNYDFYEVIYSEYAGNDPYGSSGKILTSHITNIGQVANLFVRRSVTALSGTSMTFGDGQQCASFNGSWTSQNSRIVPVYVIGYKTGVFSS